MVVVTIRKYKGGLELILAESLRHIVRTTWQQRPLAVKLKDEGNALFIKKQYADAYVKFSQAIALDDKNAIFWANRAACLLSMERHLDAAHDARKATTLDHLYPKAWARLATAESALRDHENSAVHWEMALQMLPIENVSPAEIQQRQYYMEQLSIAKVKVQALKRSEAGFSVATPDQTPFQRALSLENELRSRTTEKASSSGWVLIAAYRDFKQGVENLKMLKQYGSGPGAIIMGHAGALTDISNGVLRDSRIFHIDGPDFISAYNRQVSTEAQRWGALTEGGTDRVTSEILKLQQAKGWDVARPALSTTVRACVMRGFLESHLKQDHDVGEEFLRRALEVLEWGNSGPWGAVPFENKGTIFKKSFIQGVHVLHMKTYMQGYLHCPGPQSRFPLEKLYDEASQVMFESSLVEKEMESHDVDPGFSSCYPYPKGYAYAMIGFCHAQMAEQQVGAACSHFLQAATSYSQAAEQFPRDDENYCWYLYASLVNLWRCGTPIKDTLLIMKNIREAIPEMMKIWEHSALARQGRDEALQHVLQTEEGILEGLLNDTYKMDDMILPEYLVQK
ncbi:unnamed protein product [Somion occarium]|uniref:Uncharacterized protein n=1 Tax=Somion occarium TaxID=3059160 RepID=A0ABP1CLP4_9APHY